MHNPMPTLCSKWSAQGQHSPFALAATRHQAGAQSPWIRTLCSTMASATAEDSAAEPPMQAAPTAKPSAAECTSRPTNARLAPSPLPYTPALKLRAWGSLEGVHSCNPGWRPLLRP